MDPVYQLDINGKYHIHNISSSRTICSLNVLFTSTQAFCNREPFLKGKLFLLILKEHAFSGIKDHLYTLVRICLFE
jgi:hypothetical protein